MSTGDWAKKADDLTRQPQQADQLLDRVEDEIEDRTGHAFDQQVEQGVDAVQSRVDGDEQEQRQQTGRQQRNRQG
jgi:hypothetical protein